MKVNITNFEEKWNLMNSFTYYRINICDYKDIPKHLKVKQVAIKLKEKALMWWENLKCQRKHERPIKIITWVKMRKELKQKYMSNHYCQDVF